MTLQIGRCGPDPALGEHSSFTVAGGGSNAFEDEIQLDGWMSGSSQAETNALRAQLLGHMSEPDVAIPLVWGTDPTQTGYVRGLKGEVDAPVGVSYQSRTGYAFRYRLRATKLAHSSMPRHESIMTGAIRTNDLSITSGRYPWHGLPTAATAYDFEGRLDTIYTRTGVGGTAKVWAPATTDYFDGYPSWTLPPANFYDMATTIKVGSTLYPTVGRQIISAGNETAWEMTNGLIRIRPAASSTSLLRFGMYSLAGGPSYSARDLEIGYSGSWVALNYQKIKSISVQRNSPVECIMRLYLDVTAGSTDTYVTVDISMRRGDRSATIVVKSPKARRFGIGPTATPGSAWTNITNGHYEGADDSDGNRLAFSTTSVYSNDNTNGRTYATDPANVVVLGVHGEVVSATVAFPDDKDTLINRWYAAVNEQQRVVIP